MNAWLRARPWWQEVLVYWLALCVLMYVTGAIQSTQDSVFDPPVAALLMAAAATGIGRWKRRYDRKEDVD